MSGDYVIDAFGARWSLDTDGLDAADRDRLHHLWERCRVPGARSGDEGVEPFVVTDPDPYAVSRAVTLASLRRRSGSAVLLHAAGFEAGGRVAVLVGPSGAGKSTAALTLGRELGYVSDETVAVEPDGTVSPYPKPVSVITDPAARWDKHEESPDSLGLREVSGTAYAEVLVVLERDPEREVPELTELPIVDALLAVIAQSSSTALLDRPLERLGQLASRSGGPYVLRYSEIDACVDLVHGLLDSADRPARNAWTTTPGGTGAADPLPGTVVRAAWTEALHADDGTVVLIGEQLIRLGPIGEVVWHAAATPVETATLHDLVVAELGAHPDSESVVADGVAALVRTGVLRAGEGLGS